MRSIVNIDYKDMLCSGAFNSACDCNELYVSIRPAPTQLTNYRVEVMGVDGMKLISDVIVASGGLDCQMVEYVVPIVYWCGAGVMRVRLLSDEGDSDYAMFTCIDFNSETGDVCCKKSGHNMFIFNLCTSVDPLIEMFFPVGISIYSGVASYDPNKALAGTKWEREKGVVLVGVNESDSDFNEVNKVGGSKTNSHAHWQTMGTDGQAIYGAITNTPSRVQTLRRNMAQFSNDSVSGVRQDKTYEEEMNILQPYKTKYIWTRVA